MNIHLIILFFAILVCVIVINPKKEIQSYKQYLILFVSVFILIFLYEIFFQKELNANFTNTYRTHMMTSLAVSLTSVSATFIGHKLKKYIKKKEP